MPNGSWSIADVAPMVRSHFRAYCRAGRTCGAHGGRSSRLAVSSDSPLPPARGFVPASLPVTTSAPPWAYRTPPEPTLVTLTPMARAARIAAACAAAALVLLPAASARADDVVRPATARQAAAGLPPDRQRGDRDRRSLAGDRQAAPRAPRRLLQRLREVRPALAGQLLPARSAQQGDRAGLRQRRHGHGSPRRGPGRRSRGRWRAATPGAFGRKVNSPWVWIPLMLLFVVPFVDPRRPFRVRHLDLLVLMAFSVSVAFFNDANIDASVPIVYPLLAYLLGRMLWIGLRRGVRRDALRPLVPISWLLVGLLFLVGLSHRAEHRRLERDRRRLRGRHRRRTDSRTASSCGATSRRTTSTATRTARSTTPPTSPSSASLPWSGKWDTLPAAHAAAIFFDLLCLGLLFLIGRALRGPPLGVTLAYAWAANPFTLYAMDCNVNDALVGALVLGAIAAVASPAGRGALIGLAGMAKFAPLGLAPLFATQSRGGALRFALGFVAALVPCAVLVLAYGGAARLLRPHAWLPGLARLAVLDLGPLRLDDGADRRAGRGGAARGRGRLRPAPARHRRPLGAVGRRAHRAAARRDALVLPLHGVVPRAAARRGPGRRRARAARRSRRRTSRSSGSCPRRPSPGAGRASRPGRRTSRAGMCAAGNGLRGRPRAPSPARSWPRAAACPHRRASAGHAPRVVAEEVIEGIAPGCMCVRMRLDRLVRARGCT